MFEATKKLKTLADLVNTYYGFALILYAFGLFVASHTALFWWISPIATVLLAGWTGYVLNSYFVKRYQRYGFRVTSDVMTYEILGKDNYLLRFATKIKAQTDHLFVYPIGHQWTGSGDEAAPQLTNPDQQLLSAAKPAGRKGDDQELIPYQQTASTDGTWQYWFVGFDNPLQQGDEAEIKYTQEFNDKKHQAKPSLYYFVRTPMNRLELNVKFPADHMPKKVTADYVKSSDSSRPYKITKLRFDPDKQWASLVIEKPKKGYCYRIHWK